MADRVQVEGLPRDKDDSVAHHVVPKSYLKMFAIEGSVTKKDARVFCYFTRGNLSKNPHPKSIRDVPIVNFLNTWTQFTLHNVPRTGRARLKTKEVDILERAFSRIESEVAGLFRIESPQEFFEVINQTEIRQTVSALLATIFVRSSGFQEKIKKDIQLALMKASASRDDDDIYAAMEEGSPGRWNYILNLIENSLIEKSWTVFLSRAAEPIITSDNPVLVVPNQKQMTENKGLPWPWEKDARVIFPWNKTIALEISPRGQDASKQKIVQGVYSDGDVRLLNTYTVLQADNMAISPVRAEWINNLIQTQSSRWSKNK